MRQLDIKKYFSSSEILQLVRAAIPVSTMFYSMENVL